ncbi:hypothetical protein BT63DRAFT_414231 [Microthyrium microscopicum]|uniref:Nucleotide-sugar transporter n=1 Tax=Microthyrium microscopicum TaxID=703497 RepID=A0A6A6U7R6_9PEZI|nr:hypothetical protein BT63DRAFT_414231 [Microthyrium microscopicum]
MLPSWSDSWQSPAVASVLAVIVSQLSTGLLFQLVSKHVDQRRLLASPLIVAICEIVKVIISAVLYVRERALESDLEKDEIDLEDGPIVISGQSSGVGSLLSFHKGMPSTVMIGFAQIALGYTLSGGVALPIASEQSGASELIRSSLVIVTAIAMVRVLGKGISGQQWAALILMMCGSAVIQFSRPNITKTSVFDPLTVLLQCIAFAISSVYNQKLYQISEISFHAMNIVLFGYTAIINLIVYGALSIQSSENVSLDSLEFGGIASAVLSSVAVGLSTAAVLKYNDALVNCLVLGIAAAILFSVESVLGASMSVLVIPGTGVVVLAAYQYVNGTLTKPSEPMKSAKVEHTTRPSIISRTFISGIGLIVTTTMTVFLSTALTSYQTSTRLSTSNSPVVNLGPINAVTSPFANSIAFIRINNYLPQREALVRKAYSPYFNTVHVSMPAKDPTTHPPNETTLERDYWNDRFLPYQPVISLLSLINSNSNAFSNPNATSNPNSALNTTIDGLFYFHFDAWVEPLSFHDMPQNRIWILSNEASIPYECHTNTPPTANWIWWQNTGLEDVRRANRVAAHLLPQYIINTHEFCRGWSDLYWVPSAYFDDFVNLGRVYASIPLFHEIALPIIWRILENTYTKHSSFGLLRFLDCWGGCCEPPEFADYILHNRCGHKLDYLNWGVTKVHYERLEKNRELLGQERPGDRKSGGGWE